MESDSYLIPIPLSEVKEDFLRLYKLAEAGQEIITTINKSGLSNVSLINSDILTVLLDGLVIPIEETVDERLGGLTIAIPYLPMYGEGESREQAVENFIDAVVKYCEAYMGNPEHYGLSESAYNKAIMLKLLRYGNDKKAIRADLKL